MAKYCPFYKRKVTYMQCMDCEEKECKSIDKNSQNNESQVSEQEKYIFLHTFSDKNNEKEE